MTLGEFSNRLKDRSGEMASEFDKYIRSTFTESMLKAVATRKNVARITHVFMILVLGIEDEDWGKYAKLKDIYDCRICANAIAQVLIQGFLKPAGPDVFMGELEISEDDLGFLFAGIDEYV